MIRHMLFWNRTENAPPLTELIPRLQKSFSEMVREVSGLRSVQVAQDMGSGTHEIGLYTEFDSMEAVGAYQVHPLHLAFKEEMGLWLKDRVCVDLEAEG